MVNIQNFFLNFANLQIIVFYGSKRTINNFLFKLFVFRPFIIYFKLPFFLKLNVRRIINWLLNLILLCKRRNIILSINFLEELQYLAASLGSFWAQSYFVFRPPLAAIMNLILTLFAEIKCSLMAISISEYQDFYSMT
jgi:hypothetical protein